MWFTHRSEYKSWICSPHWWWKTRSAHRYPFLGWIMESELVLHTNVYAIPPPHKLAIWPAVHSVVENDRNFLVFDVIPMYVNVCLFACLCCVCFWSLVAGRIETFIHTWKARFVVLSRRVASCTHSHSQSPTVNYVLMYGRIISFNVQLHTWHVLMNVAVAFIYMWRSLNSNTRITRSHLTIIRRVCVFMHIAAL